MDWFRQVPIGQYVAGSSGWLRLLDPRVKFSWTMMFLLTPILASPSWRIFLVGLLLLITFTSFLPLRILWRSLCWLIALALFVGCLTMLLPTGEPSAILSVRPSQELAKITLASPSWEIGRLGPIQLGPISFGELSLDRRSTELAIKTSTLIFTVIHSVNLMLLSTPPEDIVWCLSWFMAPLRLIRFPVDRISFQLLLALRFLPLVQEELQSLLRAIASRAVNFRELGLKSSIGLILSVAERLLANILLRSEQGAEAFLARGGAWLPPNQLRQKILWDGRTICLNISSVALLLFVLGLRGKYRYGTIV